MINVLIADNQIITREGIKAMLLDIIDINVIGNAKSPTELEQMIITHQPQVLIIDHHYNNRFTTTEIENIKAKHKALHILVLTNRQTRGNILEAINLGIKNYVFKECNREELVTAVYKTANGEQYFCQNTFETLFGNKLIPGGTDPKPSLSSRENEIVQLIVAGKTNKEIAEILFLSIHTIKTHRKNIIKKIGFTFKNAADLVSYTTHA